MAVDVTVQHPYGFRPKGMPLLRVFVVFYLESTAKITESMIQVQKVDVPFLGDFKPVSQNFKILSEPVGGPFQYLLFVRYDSPFTPDFDETKLRFVAKSASVAMLSFTIDIGGVILPNLRAEKETPVIEIDPCDLK